MNNLAKKYETDNGKKFVNNLQSRAPLLTAPRWSLPGPKESGL